MSNTTSYINFSAIDFRDEQSLSSYAIPLTPFRFVPEMSKTSDRRVVWDFGDGTVSRSFSASKSYDFPGIYTVSLVVYDCNNNATISTVQKVLTVYDYTPFTMTISFPDSILDIEDNIEIECGKIVGPLTATAYYPPYQTNSSIYYTVSGSNSLNYWDIVSNKYSHLESFHTLYKREYNYAISSYQYIEIDKIVTVPTSRYAKISNGNIVECPSTDSGAALVGSIANTEIYFRDDTPKEVINVEFFFDKTTNTIYDKRLQHLNNLSVTLSAKIVDNPDVDSFSITSNGIDGEGYGIDSFDINSIKFFDTKIPFVVKVKDSDGFSVKNFDTIQLSSIVVNSGYNHELVSLNYTLSSQGSGGSFKGYVTFPLSSQDMLSNVSLTVSGTLISDTLSTYILSGQSNTFNVYNKNYYDMFKTNENFNPQQTLEDLRFQETLLDKTVLFQDFLGSLLGNEDTEHEDIGVKIYEKISNFVSNTQDLDVCEQEYIDSLAELTGYNDIGEEHYLYPEKLKRVINLASLDKSKLVGELNKFKENLDIKGRTSKTEYGINIGDKINPSTYTVSISSPIVALEKFSNQYTLLNTFQPYVSNFPQLLTEDSIVLTDDDDNILMANDNVFSPLSTYPLSAYTSEWGWPLVLPTVFDFADIEKYYLFFEYNDQYDNTSIGGVVDFDNSKTTVSPTATNSELFGVNGIFQNIFLDTLYQSLSLN